MADESMLLNLMIGESSVSKSSGVKSGSVFSFCFEPAGIAHMQRSHLAVRQSLVGNGCRFDGVSEAKVSIEASLGARSWANLLGQETTAAQPDTKIDPRGEPVALYNSTGASVTSAPRK